MAPDRFGVSDACPRGCARCAERDLHCEVCKTRCVTPAAAKRHAELDRNEENKGRVAA